MKHTEQTKKKLSEIRKKWVNDNPEKHPWKRKDKFTSKPCELFKKILVENGINFLPEINPIKDRAYAIDVAIIDKMIGFEINGNQHYNSDKTLKDYYKKRKEEIEKLGWKLYDIHYTKVFDNIFIKSIIEFINDKERIPNLEFNFFLKKRDEKFCKDCGDEISYNSKERCLKCHNISRRTDKFEKNLKYRCKIDELKIKKKLCIDCGVEISKNSKERCIKCYSIKQRKVLDRPSKELLLKEVNEIGYSATGKKYGVSDNCIRKWLK